MFGAVLLFWIGFKLDAPTLYWVIWSFIAAYHVWDVGATIYKLGKESKK